MAQSASPAAVAATAVRHIVTVATDSGTLRIGRYIRITFALRRWFCRDFSQVRTLEADDQANCHNPCVSEPEERDASYVTAEYAATNATYLQNDAFRWC